MNVGQQTTDTINQGCGQHHEHLVLPPGLLLAAGGGGPPLDTILEYDFTGDTFTQIGTMIETRMEHAISVVQYEDFSEWCQ